MSEEWDDQLDERLRGALHDLDRRVASRIDETATDLLVDARKRTVGAKLNSGSRPERGSRDGRSRRHLVPALAGFTVLALLVTVGWLARPTGSTTPPATPPTPTVSATPTPANSVSQSPADAARDGVSPVLAKLSVTRRVLLIDEPYSGIPTKITAPEGTWLISRPDVGTLGDPESLCPTRDSDKPNPADVCFDYAEILLMSTDLRRIIRAFPIPGLPPQWLALTPDALYCGRQGDGALPDSMVCRIDRTTDLFGSTTLFSGRVFPLRDAVDNHDPQNFKGWPGAWSNNAPTNRTGFDQATVTDGTLQISDFEGKPTIALDPVTLKPVD